MTDEQKAFEMPSPLSGRRSLPKREGILVYKALSYSLFPDKPDHAANCWCGLCFDYFDDDQKICRKAGCKSIPYRPCRAGWCEHHHSLYKDHNCKPLMELV